MTSRELDNLVRIGKLKDEQLLSDLVTCAEKVSAVVTALGPVQ